MTSAEGTQGVGHASQDAAVEDTERRSSRGQDPREARYSREGRFVTDHASSSRSPTKAIEESLSSSGLSTRCNRTLHTGLHTHTLPTGSESRSRVAVAKRSTAAVVHQLARVTSPSRPARRPVRPGDSPRPARGRDAGAEQPVVFRRHTVGIGVAAPVVSHTPGRRRPMGLAVHHG